MEKKDREIIVEMFVCILSFLKDVHIWTVKTSDKEWNRKANETKRLLEKAKKWADETEEKP